MPPVATALNLHSSGMPPPATLSGPKPMISMCNYTTSSCDSPRYGNMFRICQYNTIKSAITVPNRTWVVLNETRTGSRLSGFPSSAKKTSEDHGGKGWSTKKSTEDHGGKGLSSAASEVKPTRLSSSGDSCNPPPPVLAGKPDLLKVPGIGPKSLTKLADNDIAGVADLKKIYKDKFSKKSNQKMVEYLQSVGIKSKSHAKSIATFVKKTVRQEMKDGGAMANHDHAIAIPAPKKKGK